MKFLVVLALCAAVASGNLISPINAMDNELKEIIAAINHPSTDPATAAALQQMLDKLLADSISVGPAIIDDEHDESGYEPIHVGPAIIDNEHDNEYEPISVGPAIIDGGVVAGPSSSPLVQIIVNVKSNSDVSAVEPDLPSFDEIHGVPVVVDEPEVILRPIVVDENEREPINVVDLPDSADLPPVIGPISPINVPDILN